MAPTPELILQYDQGLVDNPQKETNTPIKWEEIYTVCWTVAVEKRIPGRNSVQKTTLNGELVPVKLNDSFKKIHLRNGERIRKEVAKHGLGDNDIPTLRHASNVMAFFREIEQKTSLDIERDRTVQDKV